MVKNIKGSVTTVLGWGGRNFLLICKFGIPDTKSIKLRRKFCLRHHDSDILWEIGNEPKNGKFKTHSASVDLEGRWAELKGRDPLSGYRWVQPSYWQSLSLTTGARSPEIPHFSVWLKVFIPQTPLGHGWLLILMHSEREIYILCLVHSEIPALPSGEFCVSILVLISHLLILSPGTSPSTLVFCSLRGQDRRTESVCSVRGGCTSR